VLIVHLTCADQVLHLFFRFCSYLVLCELERAHDVCVEPFVSHGAARIAQGAWSLANIRAHEVD
jgi:hypothetical protein